METSELLERYAAGDRDFRRVDLSKANLEGLNWWEFSWAGAF